MGGRVSWSVSLALEGTHLTPYPGSSPLSLLHKVEAGHSTGLAWTYYEVLCQGGFQSCQLLRAQFLEQAVEKAL